MRRLTLGLSSYIVDETWKCNTKKRCELTSLVFSFFFQVSLTVTYSSLWPTLKFKVAFIRYKISCIVHPLVVTVLMELLVFITRTSTVWFPDLLVFCSGNKSTTFASRKRRSHNTGYSFYLFHSLFPAAIGATYFTLTISSSQYLFYFILNTLTIAGRTEGCWHWKQNNRKISYWWGPWEYDLFFFFLHESIKHDFNS